MSETNGVATVESQTRCQWCGASIPVFRPHCSACGAAVVDPTLTPEAAALIDDSGVAEVPDAQVALRRQPDESRLYRPPRSDPDALLTTLLFFALAAVGGAAIGFLFGPPLLQGFFVSALEVPAGDAADFRPLGAFIGGLGGLLVGSGIGIFQHR